MCFQYLVPETSACAIGPLLVNSKTATPLLNEAVSLAPFVPAAAVALASAC